jgi:nucleotide-binding universal stress UspA family protein
MTGGKHHGSGGADQIDMVVISTHGISGWRPLVFGSIAENFRLAPWWLPMCT